jgi:hypothetical protein
MRGIDPRAWNLFGALALATPACVDEAGGGHGSSDPPHTEEPPCGNAFEQSPFRCSPPDDYYETDTDDYDYGCGSEPECGPGELCMSDECVTGQAVPACGDTLTFSNPIPLPAEADGTVVLSAIQIDADPQVELIVQATSLALVDAVEGTVAPIDAEVSSPVVAAVGAFDPMTADDLVLKDTATGLLSFLRNDGLGGLEAAEVVDFAASGLQLVAADLDGDANLDVWVSGVRWAGDGAGGFTQTAMPGLGGGNVVAFAADADAADELLGADIQTGALAVHDLDAGVEIIEAVPRDAGWSLAATDLDDDGTEDALRLQSGVPGNVLEQFFGDQLMAEPVRLGLVSRHTRIALADLDADGFEEIVAWSTSAGATVTVYRGFEGGAPCYSATELAGEVVVGDFDGDGRDELAITVGYVTTIHGVD